MASSVAHAVIVPLPIHGHVNPMLHLAFHLSSLHFNVTFITTTSTEQTAISALKSVCGEEFPPDNIRFVSLQDGNRSSSYEFAESLQFLASRRHEVNKLVESAAQERGSVTVNVLDFLLLQPFQDLPAFKDGATLTAGFFIASAAMLHVAINVNKLLERGFLPKTSENMLVNVDSSVIPGIPTDLCVSTDIPEDPLDSSYKSMSGLRAWLESTPVLLVNTFEELEKLSLDALEQQGLNNIVCVGPLLHRPKSFFRGSSEVEKLFRWLDAQACSCVLYVSFGTMQKVDAEQVVEIACALESSRQPFLWVLRGNSHCEHAIAGLKKRVGERGMIVSWCPQFEVLSHSSVGGFLTHCGWNSALESITCGVPMIAWPAAGDQIVNSKYLLDVWKLGVRIVGGNKNLDGSPRLVPRDEIEMAITSLMNNKDIHLAAKKMREKAEEAMLVTGTKLMKSFGK